MSFRRTVYRQGLQFLHLTGLSSLLAPLTEGLGAIFMLHRVLPESDRPFQPNRHLEVTPEFLEIALERIRENGYKIISIGEAIDLLKFGYGLDHGRHRYAVITFDDGFRDNYEIAYPILKREGIPFTLFLTSGFLDRSTEVWWVALERLVANNPRLDLRDFPAAPSDLLKCESLEDKKASFCVAVDWLTRTLDEHTQRHVMRELSCRYGLDLQQLADELMMTWDDARRLAEDPLVTLGGHTMTHPALARLPRMEAIQNIKSGVARMETELGRRPKYFAYPYGYSSAVGMRDAGIADEVGFRAAVTTLPGVLRAQHAKNMMYLPRVSLNGQFQDDFIVDQYLTGAPFAFYNTAKWVASGFGVKTKISRLFPSTK